MTRCRWDREQEAYLHDGEPCRTCDAVPGRLKALTKRASDTQCWPWTGTLSTQGYGVLSIHDRQFKAHRVVYEIQVGRIPDGLVIDHLCRNRACVNPDHLEVVTHTENVRRGVAPPAVNARRLACVNGHEFTPENTRHDRGKRYCLTCKRKRCRVTARKRRARERGEVA